MPAVALYCENLPSQSFQIIHGNAYHVVQGLQAKRFRAIITSPPYYGHRRYGSDGMEIGREQSVEQYLQSISQVFIAANRLLTDDGSLWIVIGDTRRRKEKLRVPHRLADLLANAGYKFREDIVWYKKNSVSSSSPDNFSQSYEYVLFFSKNSRSYANLDAIRVQGNEAMLGKTEMPPQHMLQYCPENPDKKEIERILDVIHKSTPKTPLSSFPSTSEISWAYGYDPDKFCPTCYRKFKRHVTRRRIGGHRHYPIFAVCNPTGKNPSNVWEIANRAHLGSQHFAIFPEELVKRIIKFSTEPGDWILDPFAGRGTTGIAAVQLGRRFVGIDLYLENVNNAAANILQAENLISGSGQ